MLVSDDVGENWTKINISFDKNWFSIAFGNNLFVAVAYDGSTS